MNSKGRERFPDFIAGIARDARRFANEELWDRDLNTLPRIKRLVFALCRIVAIVVKGVIADGCALRASALVYITLMSMVPILALMVSVAKGFGAQERLMELVGLEHGEAPGVIEVVEGSQLAALPEEMAEIARYVFAAVERTSFGAVGAVGVLLLFVSVLKAMTRAESSFNLIWGVREPRRLLRRFADYTSILVVVPILLLVATSVNAMLSSPDVLQRLSELSGSVHWLYVRGIRFFGIGMIILAFSFLYSFMPNTRVRAFPALAAGIFTGISWYLLQWFYIEGQVGLTKLNAIYGTFAAIPFFLLWLYASWMLVLFGAEISFAVQNHRTYVLENVALTISTAAKQRLGLLVTLEVCRTFFENGGAWCASGFRETHDIPARLLREVLYLLKNSGVLIETNGREACYVPGKDLGRLTIADVERAFRRLDDPYMKRLDSIATGRLCEYYDESYRGFSAKLAEVSFHDLLASAAKPQAARPNKAGR